MKPTPIILVRPTPDPELVRRMNAETSENLSKGLSAYEASTKAKIKHFPDPATRP